jgi:hypothetical protein
MLFLLFLVVVGGVSLVASGALEHGVGHRQLAPSNGETRSTVKSAVVRVSLAVAIFIPMLWVAYIAIGLVRQS